MPKYAAVQAQALHALERWPTSRRPGGASVSSTVLLKIYNEHREKKDEVSNLR
jgi:hypothetical protein